MKRSFVRYRVIRFGLRMKRQEDQDSLFENDLPVIIKKPVISDRLHDLTLATSYSPTQSPMQYHRRRRA